MSQSPQRGPGRPRENKIRVVVTLSPQAHKAFRQAAKVAGCTKGELIERLLGLISETKKAPGRAGASQKKY